MDEGLAREYAREKSRAWRAANRERHRAYARTYQAEHGHSKVTPEQRRRHDLKWRWGITPELYAELLEAQGGGCALCGRTDPSVRPSRPIRFFCVDHDHDTGRIRGLLCIGCNISLGYFERGWRSRLDPDKARAYLTRREQRPGPPGPGLRAG